MSANEAAGSLSSDKSNGSSRISGPAGGTSFVGRRHRQAVRDVAGFSGNGSCQIFLLRYPRKQKTMLKCYPWDLSS